MNTITWRLGLAAVFFLGLGLRLYNLDGESLWLDEILHMQSVNHSTWGEMVRYDITCMPNYTPFNHSILRLAGANPHSTEFMLRLPSALFGAFSVLLLGIAAQRMFGPFLGLASALALALANFHISKASQEVGDGGQLVFFCVAAALAFVNAYEKGRFWRWALVSLCIAAAMYSFLLAFFFCAWCAGFAILYAVFTHGQSQWHNNPEASAAARAALKKAVAAVAAVGAGGAAYAPYFFLITIRSQGDMSGMSTGETVTNMLALSQQLLAKDAACLAAALGLIAIGLLLLPGTRSRWTLFVYGWALAAMGIFGIFWVNQTVMRGHYLFSIFPALCILMAQGALGLGLLAQWLFRPSRKTAPVPTLVIAMAVLTMQAGHDLYRLYTDTDKVPWREMAFWLNDEVRPGDMVVCSPPFSFDCLSHYQPRLPKPLPLYSWDRLLALDAAQEARVRAQKGRIWFVANRKIPPAEPDVTGKTFRDYCVYRHEGMTTDTADFSKVAAESSSLARTHGLGIKQVALAYLEKKDYQKVIDTVEPYLKGGPVPEKWAQVSDLLAQAYEASGQIDSAARTLQWFGDTYPGKKASAYYYAAKVYQRAAQYDKAIALLESIKKEFPEFSSAYYELGRCYEKKQDWEQVRSNFLDFAHREDGNAYAHRCCALYHNGPQFADIAEKHYLRALELEPAKYPEVYKGLAQLYMSRDDTAKAETLLRQGCEKAPSPDNFVLLGKLLSQTGRREEAKSVVDEALKQFPDNNPLLELKNSLP